MGNHTDGKKRLTALKLAKKDMNETGGREER